MPAQEIEQYVLDLLGSAEGWQADKRLTEEQKKQAGKLATVWSVLDDPATRNLLPSIIERVVFNARGGAISLTLDPQAIERLCHCDCCPNSSAGYRPRL